MHCPATVLPGILGVGAILPMVLLYSDSNNASQTDTTGTEERYAPCPCLAVTPSVRCLLDLKLD